jgi:hypothetical protein
MKLAAIYTVFSSELLSGSIKQIYSEVDLVLISFQRISNTGNPGNFNPGKYKGSKFKFIEFLPREVNTKENERLKLNQAIQYLKSKGYTHYVLLACDHYYNTDEFRAAKITALQYDVTLTEMYTYYKLPNWRLDIIENYQMPFICRIYPTTVVSKLEYTGFRTDPSVRINTRASVKLLPRDKIMLHHYSMVRGDISEKFNNAAASIRWTGEELGRFKYEFNNYDLKENPGISYFKGAKIITTPGPFEIKAGEDEGVSMDGQ